MRGDAVAKERNDTPTCPFSVLELHYIVSQTHHFFVVL